MAETLGGFFAGDWAMAKVLGVLVAALVAWALAATAALAEEGRWQQLENNPSCVVWNANPQSNETVTGHGTQAGAAQHEDDRSDGSEGDGGRAIRRAAL